MDTNTDNLTDSSCYYLGINSLYLEDKFLKKFCPLGSNKESLQVTYDIWYLPYILESNVHPFYSFRGLKSGAD